MEKIIQQRRQKQGKACRKTDSEIRFRVRYFCDNIELNVVSRVTDKGPVL